MWPTDTWKDMKQLFLHLHKNTHVWILLNNLQERCIDLCIQVHTYIYVCIFIWPSQYLSGISGISFIFQETEARGPGWSAVEPRSTPSFGDSAGFRLPQPCLDWLSVFAAPLLNDFPNHPFVFWHVLVSLPPCLAYVFTCAHTFVVHILKVFFVVWCAVSSSIPNLL